MLHNKISQNHGKSENISTNGHFSNFSDEKYEDLRIFPDFRFQHFNIKKI